MEPDAQLPPDPLAGMQLPLPEPGDGPDDLGLVCEVDAMVAVFAAQRYANVELSLIHI